MNVIELHGVSVRYREKKIRSLKEAVIRSVTAHHAPEYFYGLHDVSLSIDHGEAVAIIGGDGAREAPPLRLAAGRIVPSFGLAAHPGAAAAASVRWTGAA